MSPFVRKVKTASGATAVQIVEKRSGVRRIVEHVGSAHDELGLALLMQQAREKLATGQDELDLGLAPTPVAGTPAARVVSSSSRWLWQVLADAYARLGFDALGDEAFRALVLARLIEPTSKADTVRVLDEIGVPSPHVNTLHAALKRARAKDYRGQLAGACMAHATRTRGTAAMVLYDVTTLHFEVADEDDLRRVGMSKEHRVDRGSVSKSPPRTGRIESCDNAAVSRVLGPAYLPFSTAWSSSRHGLAVIGRRAVRGMSVRPSGRLLRLPGPAPAASLERS